MIDIKQQYRDMVLDLESAMRQLPLLHEQLEDLVSRVETCEAELDEKDNRIHDLERLVMELGGYV